MGITDFKNKLQGWASKLTERREDDRRQPLSNMPNGSVSGYQPRIVRRQVEAERPEVHPAAAFAGMTPAGVDPSGIPQYQQPVHSQPPVQEGQGFGGQPGPRAVQTPNMNQQPLQGGRFMPQQGTGYQPQATGYQPRQATGYQPRHQSAPQPQWQGGYQPQPAPVPQQTTPTQPVGQQTPPQGGADGNVRYFPGTFRDEEGNGYAMVLRVAQITGITSCYRLLEFMQNNEAVIVNAEQITDAMEADRCLDMLFGAAYAMNQTFERIAGRLIYLIAPRHVHVLPFDSMLHMSQQDIERRWPGSSRAMGRDNRFDRRDDFAPAYGQRAAAQPGAYADYGGFGGFSARR